MFSLFNVETNPKANITLSGKKKRKLLKQLKHMQAEKSKMEGNKSSGIYAINGV